MKKKLKLEKHRDYIIKRTVLICFIFLLLIHSLDVLSTFIGLSLGAVENNPTSAYFFTFGFLGWIFSSIFIISVFLVTLSLVRIFPWIYKKMTYKQMPLPIECTLYLVFTGTIFLGLALAVLHNIRIIIQILIG